MAEAELRRRQPEQSLSSTSGLLPQGNLLKRALQWGRHPLRSLSSRNRTATRSSQPIGLLKDVQRTASAMASSFNLNWMAAQMTPRDGRASFNVNEMLAIGPGVQRMAVALLVAWLVGIIRLSALWPVLVSSWAIWLMADRHFKQKLAAERQQFLLTQTDLHPQTPEESVEWLNRLAALLWRHWLEPFFAVKLSKQLASKLLKQQSKYVEDAQLQNFTLGSAAPVFSNAQMLKHKGNVVMEMDVEFRSRDMQVTFGLKANLNSIGMGRTTVRVSDCLLVGRLRFRPCSEEQVVLASFVRRPTLSLSINVSGVILTSVPLINHWLEGTVRAAMIKKMIEPYRLAMELPSVFARTGPSLYDEHHKRPPDQGRIFIWLHGATLQSRSSSSPIIVQMKFAKLKQSGVLNPTLNPLNVVGNAKEGHQIPTSARSGSVLFTVLEEHRDRKSKSAERLVVVGTAFFQFKWMRDGRTCFWHNSTKHKPVLRKTDGVLPMRIAITTNDGGTEVGALDIEVQPSWLNFKVPSIKLATVHSADSVVETIMAAREGYWLVTLLEGRGLEPKDTNGKSDPYVQLQVGSTKRVSRVQRGTLHPVWNELFTFAKGDKLSLLTFDHDMLGNDDFLGMAEIDLFKYRDFQVHDLWIPLQGVASGDIHIRLAFERQQVDDFVVDEARAAVQPDAAPNTRSRRPQDLQLDMIQEQLTVFNGDQSSPGLSEDSLSDYSSTTGNSLPTASSSAHPTLRKSTEEEPVKANGSEGFLLTATLIKARQLHKGHLSLFSGKIDAYCKLICGGTTFKSSVVHNTADPEWGETFAFQLSAHPSRWHRHQHDSVLLVICKDKHILGRAGVTLGHCVVPLTKLIINETVEEWLPLDGHRNRGELLLRLELLEVQAQSVEAA